MRILFIIILSIGLMPITSFASHSSEKRPWAHRKPAYEYGVVSGSGLAGGHQGSQITLPLKARFYVNDSIDLYFEGWAGYSSLGDTPALSALAMPGFSYWLDEKTSLSPHLLVGYEHFFHKRTPMFVYGAYIEAKRTFVLYRERPWIRQHTITPAIRIGALTHDARAGDDFAYSFIRASLGYEMPAWDTGDDATALRVKMMLQDEVQAHAQDSLRQYVGAFLAFRIIHADNGRLVRQYELGATTNFSDFAKVSFAVTQGF